MKIINEKGKLFGIINIVDFIIILLILLVAIGATYKISDNTASTVNKTVEFKILIPCTRPELAEAISVGDKMVANNSYTDVVIKDIETKPGFSVNLNSEGQKVTAYDPYLIDIYVTNEGQTNISSATLTIGGQEVRVGKKYFVKSLDYEFEGVVTEINIKD